ncbi:hypothetical protein PoB_004399600 [Plakobranchus ocellatus]|uniref:Uncharacterized protein n=1 Tax=Plakobranchus ocellatus TaxID=259542 RepID=A0AAV4BFB7_9GAST|nr:hypothetical protein PoB_004399600 [Plakobranchus ocellatus]
MSAMFVCNLTRLFSKQCDPEVYSVYVHGCNGANFTPCCLRLPSDPSEPHSGDIITLFSGQQQSKWSNSRRATCNELVDKALSNSDIPEENTRRVIGD